MIPTYEDRFTELAGLAPGKPPHAWQTEIAAQSVCVNRLIRVPTGFGKTFGVLGAWWWNRVECQRGEWPRRLVWCLPMRVLVEQVVAEIEAALQRLGGSALSVGVHSLMGGADAGEWHLAPERDAVLVGTQDMLLSGAMNRGYGAARARWPMDFGLLNQDCLWVMDEVQLMDVGLATSAQLQAFRDEDEAKGMAARRCRTWWMSATLQSAWLRASPDTVDVFGTLPHTAVPAEQRHGLLWDDVHKPLRVETLAGMAALASTAAAAHLEAGRGERGPTLVVVNRVDHAVLVFDALARHKALRGTELRLVHSRFRPAERADWRGAFLNRAACAAGVDRIIVATQVVEAGVDMSAAVLVTELAPWPSLVQRFGRCARWGGSAQVIVADLQAADAKAAAPYDLAALNAARQALGLVQDVAPLHLEAFEEANPHLLDSLYPYAPPHLLRRRELDDLFDTAADLSGADVDISRFIRSGDERDVQVFWRPLALREKPADAVRASRAELCAVPFLKARDWLCGKGARLLPKLRAWAWNWLDGAWELAERRHIFPGQTLLVAADAGGYDPLRGWQASSVAAVVPVMLPSDGTRAQDDFDQADSSESDESASIAAGWQTVAFHGQQVGRHAAALSAVLAPRWRSLLELAGRWHDAGKVHPAFQGALRVHGHGNEIAKAPRGAWRAGRQLYRMPDGSWRDGFRHELASALAVFALLRRCRPDHAALLGPWRELLAQLPGAESLPPLSEPMTAPALTAIEAEIAELGADELDLLLYLVCSHHGKVRVAWQSSPADQASHDTELRIRGIRAGDVLPAMRLADATGSLHVMPAVELVLAPAAMGLNPHTGRGWTERVQGLLERHGPFTLAWLEAVFRAADQRATRETALADPALQNDNRGHGLERSDSPMAGPARGGEAPSPLGEHSAQRGAQLRLRRGAGRPGDAGSRTRPPAHATRYLDTRLGALSYLELAPHLALAAREVEVAIEAGDFDGAGLDDALIHSLHQRLCHALAPQLAGWRRHRVQVGTHTPPEPHTVPMLMREYALDLQARLDASAGRSEEPLLEALAFAEGRLLSIHPFADFNGRATRLFLRQLLRRLDLPDVDLAADADMPEPYLLALRAADQRDWRMLGTLWRQRFEQGAPR